MDKLPEILAGVCAGIIVSPLIAAVILVIANEWIEREWDAVLADDSDAAPPP